MPRRDDRFSDKMHQVRAVLGANIKRYRAINDVSARLLARLAGLSLSSVRRIEATGNCTIDALVAIAAALQCEPWRLLMEDP